jgi:hypothetical protein
MMQILSGWWKMEKREIGESNCFVLRDSQGLKENKVVSGD